MHSRNGSSTVIESAAPEADQEFYSSSNNLHYNTDSDVDSTALDEDENPVLQSAKQRQLMSRNRTLMSDKSEANNFESQSESDDFKRSSVSLVVNV